MLKTMWDSFLKCLRSIQLETTQQQLNESEAQRADQEERIGTLEKRYQYGQKEITKAVDESDKAKAELAMKETEFKQVVNILY